MENFNETKQLILPDSLRDNQFVVSFIKEFDAYLCQHPEVQQNMGWTYYQPLSSTNKIVISIDDNDLIDYK